MCKLKAALIPYLTNYKWANYFKQSIKINWKLWEIMLDWDFQTTLKVFNEFPNEFPL